MASALMACILSLSLLAQSCFSLQYTPHTVLIHQGGDDPGDPLILTPYVKSGDTEKGSLSTVVLFFFKYILNFLLQQKA